MQIRQNLSRVFEGHVNAKVLRAYSALANTSACAGIRENGYAAYKARVNHHGQIVDLKNGNTAKVPPRQFINASNRASWRPENNLIQSYLDYALKEARMPVNPATATKYQDRNAPMPPQHTLSFGTTNSARKIMKEVAKSVLGAQKKAIAAKDFGRGGKKHNAQSTINRKGFDDALIETHEMEHGLEWWLEQNG